MSHKTPFEQMNGTQRALHNLTHIIEDGCELSYIPAISDAIDQITALQQQRYELAALNAELVAALHCLHTQTMYRLHPLDPRTERPTHTLFDRIEHILEKALKRIVK